MTRPSTSTRLARLLGALLALALLVPPPAAEAKRAAKKKKGKGPPAPALATIGQSLDARTDQIGRCALPHLSADHPTVDVKVHIVVNGAGTVVSSQVTSNVAAPDDQKVRACVDQVVRAVAYPKSDLVLLPIDHSWSFRIQ